MTLEQSILVRIQASPHTFNFNLMPATVTEINQKAWECDVQHDHNVVVDYKHTEPNFKGTTMLSFKTAAEAAAVAVGYVFHYGDPSQF